MDKFGSPFVHFATDYAFEMPAVKVAKSQSLYSPVWMYRYEFISKSGQENGMLASHAFELPCVFGVKDHPFSKMLFNDESSELQDNMIRKMQEPWFNFIKGQEPEGDHWPQYTGSDSPIKIFDRESRLEDVNHKDLLNIWDNMRFYED